MTEIPNSDVVLVIYIMGQAAVAVVAPLMTYWLTRPHLKRVEAKADLVAVKVEEVAVQTNGMAKRMEHEAHAAGVAQGHLEERADPS